MSAYAFGLSDMCKAHAFVNATHDVKYVVKYVKTKFDIWSIGALQT